MRAGYALLLSIVLLSTAACAKRSHSFSSSTRRADQNVQSTADRININTASEKELEDLPGIGKGLAERIVEHRQKYGPFSRPEHLLMVRGISESRFQAIRDQITVE